MKYSSLFLFLFLFICTRASSISILPDSSQYKIISLDSLSDEDFALLEEYKDSFMTEVQQIKSTLLFKKQKPIDTTVALMNKSSHVEIGLDFTSKVLSNGRDASVKGVVFYPSLMYYHKTGLYASLSIGFYTDSTIRKSAPVPLLIFSPGFYRTFFKRWSFGISYSRSFSLYQEKLYQGMLNNSFNVFNSYNFWNYLNVGFSTAVSWSSNLNSRKYFEVQVGNTRFTKKVYYKNYTKLIGQAYSVNLTLSLRKDFSFFNILGAKVFTLSPEIFFAFGNDNAAFLIQGARKIGKSPISFDKFFGFLNMEPGLTADWRIRNLEIFAAFHCAISFNEFIEDGNVAGRITNPHHYYPYAEAGLKSLFRVKKKAKSL